MNKKMKLTVLVSAVLLSPAAFSSVYESALEKAARDQGLTGMDLFMAMERDSWGVPIDSKFYGMGPDSTGLLAFQEGYKGDLVYDQWGEPNSSHNYQKGPDILGRLPGDINYGEAVEEDAWGIPSNDPNYGIGADSQGRHAWDPDFVIEEASPQNTWRGY
ncbi:MAG: hypothetical protein GY915_03085 [bacterium]|nr:hypothetical protein [bacterium]